MSVFEFLTIFKYEAGPWPKESDDIFACIAWYKHFPWICSIKSVRQRFNNPKKRNLNHFDG